MTIHEEAIAAIQLSIDKRQNRINCVWLSTNAMPKDKKEIVEILQKKINRLNASIATLKADEILG